ncbi:molecular chaperone DnaJ [Neosynechococcus sphagnicola sy1]|uniref:Molecular chaperone DnaJ n=1 Tax=Neosynechococcus sphagnicola sy1 TaxID=1497020 RepID=A0A098THF5_9CYAN|nr:J domain-containing protein [Neosynechococcus sphagnicola]KGF71514.1 molecular chaperone DnaJ [Neosynechococcus sphagnicola sy1]
MNLADCYQLLELKVGASFADIKASYRRLARQYHPDVNQNDHQAKEKFIALAEAYQYLLRFAQPSETPMPGSSKQPAVSTPHRPPTKVRVTTQAKPTTAEQANLSALENQLKQSSYQQLQYLLKSQRFPRAIALIEGLAQRLPQDPEVRQWQAITYQRLGRYLVSQRQLDKARIYLKKALRTDPHNRSLWAEVEQDFRRIEQVY